MPESSQKKKKPGQGFNRLRKEQLRYILNNISDLLCLHDLEGRIIDVNRKWQDENGIYGGAGLVEKNLRDFIPERYAGELEEYMGKVRKEGRASGIVSLLTGNGSERVLEYRSLLLSEYNGSPVVAVCMGPDVTDRLKSQRALEKSEQKYRGILEAIEDGYYEVDLNGTITFCNPSMCRIVGYSEDELLKMNYSQISHPDFNDEIYKTFRSVFLSCRPTKAHNWKLVRKDGTCCIIEASISPVEEENGEIKGFRGICRDITERTREENERQNLEAQLFYSQKTRALGTLAGGFAHNFNNILFPLTGYIEMALMDMPEEDDQRSYLEKALESANRAKTIVRRVQEYTRSEKDIQIQPVSVTENLKQAVSLLKESLSRRIKLSTHIDDNSPRVLADSQRIQQVVVNLFANANEAVIAAGGAGSIELKAFPVMIDSREQHADSSLPPGRYVYFSVKDSGTGIEPELIDRVFDPFFTTSPETGKGLGLSLSHRIIKKFGGEIYIESEPGRGTIVHVYLPEYSGKETAAG